MNVNFGFIFNMGLRFQGIKDSLKAVIEYCWVFGMPESTSISFILAMVSLFSHKTWSDNQLQFPTLEPYLLKKILHWSRFLLGKTTTTQHTCSRYFRGNRFNTGNSMLTSEELAKHWPRRSPAGFNVSRKHCRKSVIMI